MRNEPHPVDVHVGARIRHRRMSIGISQEALAERLGLTFQQVQKYERGANRVSASRLWQIAHILSVPVGWFFQEMPGTDDEPDVPTRLFERVDVQIATLSAKLGLDFRRALLEFLRAAVASGAE